MTNDSWPVEVTPETAAEAMRDRGALYLDVRTVHEFVQGHPADAYNVPILLVDGRTGVPRPNPEFLAVVREHFETDAEIYCGCRSGPRSLQATMLLRQAGYERVSNVECGFHGKSDALGRPVASGWRDRGLPVSDGDGGLRSFEALRGADGGDQAT